MSTVKVQKALLSVFHKEGLDEVVRCLSRHGIQIVSTGGTQAYISSLGVECTAVEDITDYPSIFGGRVKTLHPAIFGGILSRRDNPDDEKQAQMYGIDPIDLVIVDLYPFADTVQAGGSHEEIIEKIDIGGISLIRAAAKNYKDVVVIPSKKYYSRLIHLLDTQKGCTREDQRRELAAAAFTLTSRYDERISRYFIKSNDAEKGDCTNAPLSLHYESSHPLRYGENPHQKGVFYGDLQQRFEYIQGKELSYNNLLDIDAALHLISEFSEPACAILKHNTPCGLAVRPTIEEAYKAALSCDPVSAFGGIIILNRQVDESTASEIDSLFYEVLIAPEYTPRSLEILTKKSKRILLKEKGRGSEPSIRYRSILGGLLAQEQDSYTEQAQDLKCVTECKPTESQTADMLFAQRAVKHCKSNAIVLAKGQQILGAGYGQTSRVDALKQAIGKAKAMGFDLHGAVMSSDAFFPFADCVEIAYNTGITAVIQPGGSIKDQDSINYCNEHGMVMVFTGIRHFRH